MEDSILTTVKKHLGITEEYTHFDLDIVDHINSTFAILWQLGVGPDSGFKITGKDEVWSDFLTDEDPRFNTVISYIEKKVKLMFDPPQSSVLADAMNRVISELEWRLNVQAETSSDV